MEQSPFSIGRRDPQTPRRRRKTIEKNPTQPSPKSWFILPYQRCSSLSIVFVISMLEGSSYATKRRSLELYGYPFLLQESPLNSHILKTKEEALQLLDKNHKVRWILKRFLNRIRMMHIKLANETDPITLSPPEHKVYLIRLKERFQYVFEADSVMRDIHNKLLHNQGQFPDPIHPRNPLTNEALNPFEVCSLYKQCKALGKTSWAIEGFAACQFNTDAFLSQYRKQLRLSALKQILKHTLESDGIELVIEFIEMQHTYFNKLFSELLYRWALLNMSDNPFIYEWKTLCKRYNTIEITMDDTMEKIREIIKIRGKCKVLITVTLEIIYETRRKKKDKETENIFQRNQIIDLT